MSEQGRRLRLTTCTIDLSRRAVIAGDGSATRLTEREAELLAYLAARAGQTVGREELLQQVWGYAPTVTSRAADATAARLRAKIEADTDAPVHLQTVHGEGYRLVGVTSDERQTSTPAARTTFFGRTAELAWLDATVASGARLISLTGPPGTGKTRLALHWLASRTAPPGGAWFCDLSAATDHAGVHRAVARVLDLAITDLDPAAIDARLEHAVAARGPALWVLDNAEQVVDAAAELVDRWLAAVPEATLLVTSRERLGLDGEHRFAVPPLSAEAACALFADRAGPAEPALTQAIVDRLDRLPLAIELAAARVGLLTPVALLARLDQRFTVLRARRRDRTARQSTMRGALDGSWDLLTPEEQRAFTACATFRGPFELDAAEAVLGPDALDALQGLHDKSLLTARADGWLTMLHTVAAYARERRDSAGRASTWDSAHLEWFAGRLDSGRAVHPDELDDLLAAASHGVAMGAGDAAARALLAADTLLQRHGSRRPILDRMHAVLALEPSESIRVRLLIARGEALRLAGDASGARDAYTQASAIAASTGDPALQGAVLTGLGQLDQVTGALDDAGARLGQAVELLTGVGRPELEGWARARLGVARMRTGDLDDAAIQQDRAAALARTSGDAGLEAFVHSNLLAIALRHGDLATAARAGRNALACAESAGDHRMAAIAAANLGTVASQAGELDDAAERFDAALALHRSAGNRPGACGVLANLGDVELSRGRPDAARRHLEEALILARELGAWRQEGLALLNLGLVAEAEADGAATERYRQAVSIFDGVGEVRLGAIARSHLGAARVAAGDRGGLTDLVAAESALHTRGDRLQAALATLRRGEAERITGDLAKARAALNAADSVREALGLGESSDLGVAAASLRAQLQSGP
ncbi:MAG: putative ATPase/DNA-binding winged helix-turn-helix (wHTH) protein/Tfp pilus assembly protein PilF [Myxococcota bacterium]|jgi:predicted ATPase/DNA-binding winged helix-turn-helix (wHTH) protein/Tfp pilus assembly protein PilF